MVFLLIPEAWTLLQIYLGTNISRVPECLSPRPNWDSPPPLLLASVPPLGTRGGGGVHTPACGVWGSPNYDDWTTGEKALHSAYSVLLLYLVI